MARNIIKRALTSNTKPNPVQVTLKVPFKNLLVGCIRVNSLVETIEIPSLEGC